MKPAIVYRLGKHDEEFSLVQQQDRMRQIANTLARHGLGYLVGILGLERFVPFHRGVFKHPRRPQPSTRPEHVRMALEELGATLQAWSDSLNAQ